jgi:uroporphyrinogen-III synthase
MRNLRALVTRPRREAEPLAVRLAERGIDTVIEPMMTIVDPVGVDSVSVGRGVVPDFAGVRAILCTSANGVQALARACDERGVPVFAVGDATARAARGAGFAAVESAGGDVDDLARLVAARLRPGEGRLLHVAGSETAGDLAGRLGLAGFAVERAVLYEARAADALSPATARLIDDGAIDLALFFSPRTAAIFGRLAETANVAGGLRATTALSISSAADEALGDLPFRARLIATAPTQAALLALVDTLSDQPAGVS